MIQTFVLLFFVTLNLNSHPTHLMTDNPADNLKNVCVCVCLRVLFFIHAHIFLSFFTSPLFHCLQFTDVWYSG